MKRIEMKRIEMIMEDSLTVKELIHSLKMHNPDSYVLLAADYGDHGHTIQALPVSNVGSSKELDIDVEQTAYSESGLRLTEGYNEDSIHFIILSHKDTI